MLGFNAGVGLDEGLAKSIAWHLERRAGTDKAAALRGVPAA